MEEDRRDVADLEGTVPEVKDVPKDVPAEEWPTGYSDGMTFWPGYRG